MAAGGGPSVDDYFAASVELLDQARESLSRGLLLGASECYWGAINHAVAANSEVHGFSQENYRDVRRALQTIEEMVGADDMTEGFDAGLRLHFHFYRLDMSDDEVRRLSTMADDLVVTLHEFYSQQALT